MKYCSECGTKLIEKESVSYTHLIRIVQGGNPLEIHLGGKVYQSDTTISYDLYKKYYHTKKGLKVIWKPEDYLFNSKIKDISDNFRIEVNYKSCLLYTSSFWSFLHM